jgi:Biotin-lipoyl like/ABC-2 type transporter
VVIAAGLLVAGLAGFGVWKMFLAAPGTPAGVIAVSGWIEGDDSAVAAKTSGRIREVTVREGDHVTAGQVIATLDDQQIRAREQQAEAAVRQAEARVEPRRRDGSDRRHRRDARPAGARGAHGRRLSHAGVQSLPRPERIAAHEFLLGKIIAGVIIGMAEWILCLGIVFTLFDLGIAGDPTPFVVATLACLFCGVAFGTLVGVAIPSQAAAMQAVQLGGFLLAFLLSGLIFPVENIPAELPGSPRSCATRSCKGAAGRRCGRRFRPSAPSAWPSTRSRGVQPGACR